MTNWALSACDCSIKREVTILTLFELSNSTAIVTGACVACKATLEELADTVASGRPLVGVASVLLAADALEICWADCARFLTTVGVRACQTVVHLWLDLAWALVAGGARVTEFSAAERPLAWVALVLLVIIVWAVVSWWTNLAYFIVFSIVCLRKVVASNLRTVYLLGQVFLRMDTCEALWTILAGCGGALRIVLTGRAL